MVIDKYRREIMKMPRLYEKHIIMLATIELNYNWKKG